MSMTVVLLCTPAATIQENYMKVTDYRIIGWKRPLRLSGPTIKPALPSPPLNLKKSQNG